MAESKFGRREVLAGAGAAGALAVLGGLGNATIAKADEESSSGGLGTFLITVTSGAGGPPPFLSVVGFAAGGVFTTTDANTPGSSAVGAWDRDGDAFEARFIQFIFDPKGSNVGYIRIDAKGKVDGDSTSGTFTVTVVPNSGPTQPGGSGTFAGKRITI